MDDKLINIAIEYLKNKKVCSLSWLVYYCYYTNNDFNLSFEQIESLIIAEFKSRNNIFLFEDDNNVRFTEYK